MSSLPRFQDKKRVYKNEQISNLISYNKMLLTSLVLFSLALISTANAKEYCQPDNTSCWPTANEIEAFKASLEVADDECLVDFPTFTSVDEPGELLYNYW